MRTSTSRTLLLIAIAALGPVGCSEATSAEFGSGTATGGDGARTWNCASTEVPMGETVRCISAAVGSEAAIALDGDAIESSFECDSSTTSSECPPPSADAVDDTPASDPATPSPSEPSSECGYSSDLSYCSSDTPSESGGSPSETPSCTKANCDSPGQTKKAPPPSDSIGDSSGDSTGEPSSPPSSGDGKGHHYRCAKHRSGSITCDRTPKCAGGARPGACGACVEDSDGESDCLPPVEGGCWVTGGGFIEGGTLAPVVAPADGHDNFGGNAKPMRSGAVKGHWNHVDHGTGAHALGRPEYLVCRTLEEPGPGQPGGKKGLTANQIYFGGHARFRTNSEWSDGYWFDVVAKDHGEPGSSAAAKKGSMPDTYHFTIRKIDDPALGASGKVVYETRGDLAGGNIQIHAPNPGHPAVSSPLPAWVDFEP